MIPKFRAWVKYLKQMVDVDELRWYPSDENPDQLEFHHIWFTPKNSLTRQMLKIEDVELLQWTGLKNIYEGDIIKIPYTWYDYIDIHIKVPYNEYIIGIVAFNQEIGAFGVILPEDTEDLIMGFNSFEHVFDELGMDCEIIGTRFEDRSLLEGFDPVLLEK